MLVRAPHDYLNRLVAALDWALVRRSLATLRKSVPLLVTADDLKPQPQRRPQQRLKGECGAADTTLGKRVTHRG